MTNRSTKLPQFNSEDLRSLPISLEALGIRADQHPSVIRKLQNVAYEHRQLIALAERSPSVAEVRDALRNLADYLRNSAELPDKLPSEAWDSLLGLYPASTVDTLRYRGGI